MRLKEDLGLDLKQRDKQSQIVMLDATQGEPHLVNDLTVFAGCFLPLRLN